MKKRSISALTFAFTIGATLLVAAPAQAGVYQCSSGYVCSWHGSGYVPDSSFYQRASSGNYPSIHQNKISSVSNRTGSVVFFYKGTNYTGGAGLRLGNGGTYVDLTTQGFNDNIESVVVA